MKKETIGNESPKKQKNAFSFILNTTIFLILITLSSGFTTQYIAYQFNYHPTLSGHLSGVFYQPIGWMSWAIDWWSEYPDLFQRGLTIFTGGCALSLLIYATGMMFMSRRAKAVKGLHGTAHWASKKEVEVSGLLPSKKSQGKGVYVGAWKDTKEELQYLRHDGPEHVLAFAPTRSGKGVGLVLPTLLSWPHSVLCYDIKGENWALTSGWRKKYANNKVMKFDPASNDADGVSFNPLTEIRLGEVQEVGDAQNIATMLVDPEGKGLNDHWSKTGHALLTGAILHCCYVNKNTSKPFATLKDVGDFLSNPEKTTMESLEEMLKYEHIVSTGDTHELIAQEARSMMNKDERELSSVVSTAVSFLTLYRDPIVAKNTSRSDFRIHDLMNDEKPVSLYLVVRPSDSERLRPLIRLLITQVVRRLTEKMDFEDGASVAHYKHRLLMLLDEFASLKKLSVIEEALAFMAGYGIKAYLIVQDLQQIIGAYGREEGLVGNCHIRISYAPNKIETAELLSKMSGTTTIIRKQTTVSGKRFSHVLGNVSETMQEVSRPLITADEAMRLPGAEKDAEGKIIGAGHMLIFVAGHAPIYGRQILYFRDSVFSVRAKVSPPSRSDKTRISAQDRQSQIYQQLA